jgi:protein O-GlcNAc transferase
VAPSPITGPSHAAMFTGLYPGRLGVRDNATTPLPEEYERAAELNPANPRARLSAIQVASQVKRFDRAEAHARHLLAIGYQPARPHVALGQLAQMQGRTAEADQHYRQALSLEPGLRMAEEALQQLSR